MPNQNSSSIETFNNFVIERFGDFKNSLAAFIAALAQDDKQQKIDKAKIALDAANSLRLAFAQKDHPAWLNSLATSLQNYVTSNGHPSHGNDLIRAIGLHFGAVEDHKWAFEFSDDKGFDFDGVFRKYESESQIPKLFDKIVELLEKIIQCEDLDSRKIIQTLEAIIATLKKNRDGSYFGMMGSWNFVSTYLHNLAWNVFLEIPVLKIFVKPLRDTLDDMNKEMEKLHENMQTELHNRLQADFPVLEYHDLPIPEPLALTDETIINVEATLLRNQDNKTS